jgi:uncharacterized protein (DUF1501 family)
MNKLEGQSMQRRDFLRNLAAGSLAIGHGATWLSNSAQAQTSSGYRALIGIFLYGGNDGLNMVTPIDDSVARHSYTRYKTVRGDLALPNTGAGALVPLTGSPFSLHPSLSPLASIWNERALALVHNVGPLAQPMTQAQFVAWRNQNDPTQVPDNLYSHSDQQMLWENGSTEQLRRTGWGGLLAEQLGFKQVVSVSGNTRFGGGNSGSELVLPGNAGGSFGLDGFNNDPRSTARRAALDVLLNASSSNAFHATMAQQQRTALDMSARLGSILKQQPGDAGANAALSTAFNNLAPPYDGQLPQQLYQIAKLLDARSSLGGDSNLFFASMDGFDTHSGQLGGHAALMIQMGNGIAALWNAIKALGLANQVTIFTMSDFGRTFKPNSSAGTDHAWGNEHLVIGGSVNGQASYGTYPSLELGGPDDAADPKNPWEFQGRWIPTTAVSQYGGELARWLRPSIDTASLSALFPRNAAFNAVAPLGLMKAAA